VKDPDISRAHALAHDVLSDRAMDQALSWLIELDVNDEAQQLRFQAWLAADATHRAAFEKVQGIWHSPPVAQAATALESAPASKQIPKPSRWQRLRPHVFPLGTAAVVLLGIFSFSNLPMRLEADHLTVAGERQRLQLKDGSKVLLNTNSAFSSAFTDRQPVARLLQGEAFFEVPVAHGLPLEIQAGPARLQGSSSAFAVRYLDGVAQIQVERGAVSVQAATDNTQVSLVAGDSIRVGPDGFSQREKLDETKDLAWVQGRLIFDNCPMSEVLAELRRYYPGWIVNTNPHLNQVAVTGNYRLDNPLDVVRSLARITSASLHELPALVILN
jgi:transmembrane sensor